MALIFRGPPNRRRLALTIDDFPSSGLDQPASGSLALLDLLRHLAIPATCFVIGEQLQRYPAMAARAIADGHELGNHMLKDQWSILLGKKAFLNQLDTTAELIHADLASAGLSTRLRCTRPSGGWCHPAMVTWAASRGYRTVLSLLWPFDGLPIAPPQPLQRWWLNHLAHPGGIIVLHDTPAATADTYRTLQAVVPALQQRGYSFVTLSGLLDSPDAALQSIAPGG